MTWRHKLYYTC